MTSQKTTPNAAKAATPAPEPSEEQRAEFKAIGGSDDFATNMEILKRTFATAWPLDGARDDQQAMVSLGGITKTIMAAFEPKDEVQGLLVAQIVGLHHGVMECLRRAVLPTQNMDGGARCYREAASLSAAMMEAMSTLDKWRRKAEPAART